MATTHATLATLTSLGHVYAAPRARAVYLTEPNWARRGDCVGTPSVAAKKRDCSPPTEGGVGGGGGNRWEQEQVVGPVAQEVAREDETPTGCAFATLHHEDE